MSALNNASRVVAIESGSQAISFTNEEQEVINQAISILQDKFTKVDDFVFTSPEAVSTYIMLHVATLEREVMGVLFLDNQHRLIANDILFTGTIDAASVYPREVVKKGIYYNSAAVILYHNHPSGVAEPSQADRRITSRLSDSLALLDMRVLDHFVVGQTKYVSFAERGWI